MEGKSMAKEIVVGKITDYIESHLTEDLSLHHIAEELNYSQFYMERVFSKIRGTTIYQYIRERRLTKAAEQLVVTNRPIIDIALEAGYSSPQAFTQAFSSRYLCPPRVYRKMRGIVPRPTVSGVFRMTAAVRVANSEYPLLFRIWKGRAAA
ncbi:MAG: AraC family transcriptional regulator [Lachnospiraceae bacterium]|nr:AraC family transcriptional regulator [Lachnospiraceae bacterium]